MCVCVCVCVWVGWSKKQVYFKESAHTITEAENSGPRRMDGVCYSKSKSRGRRSVSQLKDGQAERNFFWTQPFILFRPSKDSIRPTHTGRQSGFIHRTDWNVSPIQKHLHRHKTPPEIRFNQIFGHVLGPVHLTYKMSHQTHLITFQLSWVQGRYAVCLSFIYNPTKNGWESLSRRQASSVE